MRPAKHLSLNLRNRNWFPLRECRSRAQRFKTTALIARYWMPLGNHVQYDKGAVTYASEPVGTAGALLARAERAVARLKARGFTPKAFGVALHKLLEG